MSYFKLDSSYKTPKVYTQTLQDEKGLDYSSDKFKIETTRSQEKINFIHRDRNNHKRYGFEQVCQLNWIESGALTTGKVNGMWHFRDSNGGNHTIVHCGNRMFSITSNSDGLISDTISKNTTTELKVNNIGTLNAYYPSFVTSDEDIGAWNDYSNSAIKDQKSWGIVRGDRLYILCGAYLVFGKWDNVWQLRTVRDNEDTYIPTIYTNVNVDGSLAPFEQINMLSSQVKYRMIGVTPSTSLGELSANGVDAGTSTITQHYNDIGYTNAASYEFSITSDLVKLARQKKEKELCRFDFTMNGNNYYFAIPITTQEDNTYTYIYSFDKFNNGDNTVPNGAINPLVLGDIAKILYVSININASVGSIQCFITFTKNVTSPTFKPYTMDSTYKIPNGIKNSTSITLKNIETNTTLASTDYVIDYSNSTITIKTPNAPINTNYPNLEMIFRPSEDITGYQKIDGAKFGCIFSEGDYHTLFVANGLYDYHTSLPFETESTYYEDLTYFGDLGYTRVGVGNNEITGYSLLEDGYMAIHKEYSNEDSCMFIRSKTWQDAIGLDGLPIYKQDGESVFQELIFPLQQSAIGEGCINYRTCANLVGDKLMASNNGIFGLIHVDNSATDSRYAKERSSLIKPNLIKEIDGNVANAIVYDSKYFIYVGGTKNRVYVADAQMSKTYTNEDDTYTFSYEWYALEGIDAQTWFINENNQLMFGDSEGRICKFMKDKYVDVTYEKITISSLADGKVVADKDIADYDKKIYIINSQVNYDQLLYDRIAYIDSANEWYFGVDGFGNSLAYLKNYKDRKIIYFDTNNTKKEAYLRKVEDETSEDYGKYYLATVMGGTLVTNYSTTYLYYKMDILECSSYEGSGGVYTYNIISLASNYFNRNAYVYSFANNLSQVKSYVKVSKNVKAETTFPILTLGSFEYYKTINNISLVFNTVTNGSLKLGINTKAYSTNLSKDKTIGGITYASDGTDVDYFRTSYITPGLAKSYVYWTKIKHIDFIELKVSSEDNKDCSLESVNINYILVSRIKGVS